MQSVGTRLRDARVKKGYTLDDVHARTRIPLKSLTAIESDDLLKISSPFTYRAFVRQMADATDLDPETLAADALIASSSMPEPLVPGQGDAKIFRSLPLYPRIKGEFFWSHPAFLTVAVLAVAAAGFLWSRHGELKTREYVAQVSRTEVSKVPSPSISQALPLKAAVTLPPASRQRHSAQSGAGRTPKPKNARGPVQAYTLGDAGDSHGIHIRVSAVEPTWLLIEADGKQTYTGLLETAETKVLDGHDTAKIETGNAGGVSITFNGRLLGMLGPHGQARTFVFTKTGYEVIEPSASLQLTRLSQSGE